MGHPVRLVKGDPSSRPDERHRFSHDLLRLRNVDEHETRCCEIERGPWQLCGPGIPAEHIHICQAACVNHLACQVDGILAPLDADDVSRRPDVLGEELETTVWPTADLNNVRTRGYANLIEEPARLCAAVRLRKPSLLPVAQNAGLIGSEDHFSCPHRQFGLFGVPIL